MPKTLQLDGFNPDDILTAATALQAGGTVAFATETVYGLGANALSSEAVARIFAAKQRPSWDPLIVHVAEPEALTTLTQLRAELEARVHLLADAFWPGPLTLLLPRAACVPDAVTAGRALVGIRIPAHPAAQALLRACKLPLAAPSANRFGHTSPTTAQHVLDDLDGRIDAVLDAGPTSIGVESTVLDPGPTPMVLYRPGAISAEQITAATGVPVQIYVPAPDTHAEPQALPSPGVGIRHYAPRARVVLVEGNQPALQAAMGQAAVKQGNAVLLPSNWQLAPGKAHDWLIEPWANWEEPEALAAQLFRGLRSLDDRGAQLILCPLPPPGGLHDAIRDRLQKAARSA